MQYVWILVLFLMTPVAAEPQTAHDFSLPAIDGKNLNLADYRGKALLLIRPLIAVSLSNMTACRRCGKITAIGG